MPTPDTPTLGGRRQNRALANCLSPRRTPLPLTSALNPTNDTVRWWCLSITILSTFFLMASFSRASVPTSHDVVSETHREPAVHRDSIVDSQTPHLDGPEYSMFMHHSSGLVLVTIALLLLIDRFGLCRPGLTTVLIGCTWLLFGAFLFIKSDPDEWPISLTFMESLHKPTTRNERIQHKLLALIPVLLGSYTLSARPGGEAMTRTYGAAGAALLGGIGLLIHQHWDHQTFDMVNFQHRLFALSAMVVAGGLLLESWGPFTWKGKLFVVPLGILILGVQLVLYVE
jgi:hypothetical protein